MPNLPHGALAASACCVLTACASTLPPTAPSLNALQAQARDPDDALSVCPGTPAATAAALRRLGLGESLMEAHWEMHDISHNTRPIAELGSLFPGVQAQDRQDVLTVTPVRTRLGRPIALLHAITSAHHPGTSAKDSFNPVGIKGAIFTAGLRSVVLGCTANGAAPGYRVVATLRELPKEQPYVLTSAGSDTLALPDGRVWTTVYTSYTALGGPSHHVSDVVGAHHGEDRATSPGRLAPLDEGWNNLPNLDPDLSSMERHNEVTRTEARVGSGWYPLDDVLDRWVYVVWTGHLAPDVDAVETAGGAEVFFNKEPRPKTPYATHTDVQVAGVFHTTSSKPEITSGAPPYPIWVWAGHEGTTCPDTLKCGPLANSSLPTAELWRWSQAHPYGWTAGAWTTPERAIQALRSAGVDLRRGTLMRSAPRLNDEDERPERLEDAQTRDVGGVAVSPWLPY